MTLRKVYIRYKEDVPENTNCYAALDGFRQLGVETVPFYGFGDIDEMTDLGTEVGIVGYLGDVWEALAKLGIERPCVSDYPPELKDFIRRHIDQVTLETVRTDTGPIFVKPVFHKLFTGFVWEKSKADRLKLAPYPSQTPCWISDVVDFVSEYRVFVLDGQVLDVRRYKGRWDDAPAQYWINGAVEKYTSAPRAYSIDVGITGTGNQYLVEVNDCLSLGSYGLASVPYAKMMEARWTELTGG